MSFKCDMCDIKVSVQFIWIGLFDIHTEDNFYIVIFEVVLRKFIKYFDMLYRELSKL